MEPKHRTPSRAAVLASVLVGALLTLAACSGSSKVEIQRGPDGGATGEAVDPTSSTLGDPPGDDPASDGEDDLGPGKNEGDGNGTGGGNGDGNGTGGGNGEKDAGRDQDPVDASVDDAGPDAPAPGTFGAPCTGPQDCQSLLCFRQGGQSYCSIPCLSNAQCPKPPTSGTCAVSRGACRK